MSIEVRIPKEIMEYKEKIIFGLSGRQLASFAIALPIGGLGYYGALQVSNQDVAGYAAMIIAMPIWAIGFIKKNGFTFEKYVALMVRHMFGKSRREYKTELAIEEIVTEAQRNMKKKRGVLNVFNAFNLRKKDKATEKSRRECSIFEITAKSRKRKSKEAIREIEAARKDYRAAKQATKKSAKKGSSSPDSTANDQI